MYWFTGEYLDGNDDDPPSQTNCTCEPNQKDESADWKESLIKQEDRKLDGGDGTCVENR